MHAVRVIPLAALPPTVPQVLDYFWTAPLPRGAIVAAMVGRRKVEAVVLESLDLSRGKMTFKKAAFELRKLESVICATPQATEGQLTLAHWMAQQYVAGPAACIKTILPSFIGKRGKLLELPADPKPEKTAAKVPVQFVLTQPDTALKRMENMCATAKGQTLILVPEVALAQYLAEQLKAAHPTLVHGGMGARATIDSYRAVLDGSARVVVGTRVALFLPWHDLEQVIVEDPQHEAYKSEMAPRYAAPDVARQLAAIHGATVTMLTPSLAATHAYIAESTGIAVADEKPHWPQTSVISMTAERMNGNRSPFSRTAKEAILDARDRKEPVLLYSGRRAYATVAACAVCQKPSLCENCQIPMRVHRYAGEDTLVCYRCAAFTAVPKRCPACQTGTFRPAGLAGSQKIAEGLDTLLDRHGLAKVHPLILDSDLVQNDAQEAEMFTKLDAMDWPVLVGTAMTLGHRYERRFGLVVIMQADALSYNPDFRTHERLIWQLEKLADFMPHTLLVQAWQTDGILADAPTRSWDRFLKDELAQRKALGWPPFSRLVKIACSHRDAGTAARQARLVADRLRRAITHLRLAGKSDILGPSPALAASGNGRWTHHVILKTTLAGSALSQLLFHVPAGAVIDVDPRSIT